MKILLNYINIKNFKGYKKYTFTVNGQNVTVYGDNGTGKTTLYDAFLWLLFDKDSSNRKDFSIKPQDSNGNEIHMIDTEVEAELLIDGVPLKLKKQFSEKWTKKRGQQEQEYSGNETSYWIDDVPVKKNEYTARIDGLVNEELFKLITSPSYFNSLKWDARRKVLFDMVGAVTDDMIINSNPDLAKLNTILAGKSVEDYRKILAERIKKLNKDIADIPVRVDELTQSMPQEQDYSAVEAQVAGKIAGLAAIDAQITDAGKVAAEVSKKYGELAKLKLQLDEMRRKLENEANADRNKLCQEKSNLGIEKDGIENNITACKSLIRSTERDINDIDKILNELRAQYKKIYDSHYDEPQGLTCSMCGQSLPADTAEVKIAEMRKKFEDDKAKALESNKSTGLFNKSKYNDLTMVLEQDKSTLQNKQAKLAEINTRLAEIENILSKPEVTPDPLNNPDYNALQSKISSMQAELNKPVEDTTAELRQQKQVISDQITELNKTLASKRIAEQTKCRINDLMDEEKKLAQQITEYDGHKYLLEQFTKTKVSMLTDGINSKFGQVRWKLFDTQVNGAVIECCDCMINTNGSWVPYSDANSAGRINAGMDIIAALSNHYGVYAPVFADNAESITQLLPIDSQVIRLVVSEQDKALRVEA